MRFTILIIFLILASCNKEINQTGIREDLYNEIIKYQKENPINKESEDFLGKNHFVYKVTLLPSQYANSEDKHNSVFITLSVFGVGNEVKKNCYGIYEDENLQKTIIHDEANLIDKFVEEKKKENLENHIVKNPPIIDLIYPIKMYNIQNGKLKFIEEMAGNNQRN